MPPLQLLWTRLRVQTSRAICSSAGKARATGVAIDVRSVAVRVLYACPKFMFQDWFRVGLRRSALGKCPQWLLSRNPAISLDRFWEWWCASEALCRVRVFTGARPVMKVLWDVHFPAPLPPLQVPAGFVDDGVDVDLAADMDLGAIDTFD